MWTIITEAYQHSRTEFKFAIRRGRLETSVWEKVGFFLALGLILFVSLFPFYVMVMTSIMPGRSLYSLPVQIFPNAFSLTHYEAILGPQTFPFFQYFGNSLLVASVTAALSVAVATLGGYSFARLEYAGRSLVAKLVLVVYLFAGILLVVPLFQIIVSIGLVDTLYSLMLTYLVRTLPLALYMLGNYFRSIPQEIEEAALMDGYSRLESIFRITLPLSAPAIVAVYLFTFMASWNEYLFASIFLKSPGMYTLPIGIENLQLSFSQVWGQIMAASVLTSIPVVVMFLYLEKFMIEGLTVGGVEG
jgi:multiple sugar transport system permease protein